MSGNKISLILSTILAFCLVACSGHSNTNNEQPTSDQTPTHEHTFNNETWEYDEECHWHPSTCGHDVQGGKTQHNFVKTETNPTFESDGLVTYTCSVCGYSYSEKGQEKLQHNYSTEWTFSEHSHWHSCTDSGYENLKSDESEHTFINVVTDPTYDFNGYTTHTCSVCGYSFVDCETDKLVHHYKNEWDYDESTHWHSCTDSGYESLKANESAHTFTDTIVEPTGLTGGYTLHKCTICNYSFIDNETDPLTYTVTWINPDGSILEVDTNLQYGETPVFNNESALTYWDSAYDKTLFQSQFKYVYVGWDKEIEPVTEDVVYTATYNQTPIIYERENGQQYFKLGYLPQQRFDTSSFTQDELIELNEASKNTDSLGYFVFRGNILVKRTHYFAPKTRYYCLKNLEWNVLKKTESTYVVMSCSVVSSSSPSTMVCNSLVPYNFNGLVSASWKSSPARSVLNSLMSKCFYKNLPSFILTTNNDNSYASSNIERTVDNYEYEPANTDDKWYLLSYSELNEYKNKLPAISVPDYIKDLEISYRFPNSNGGYVEYEELYDSSRLYYLSRSPSQTVESYRYKQSPSYADADYYSCLKVWAMKGNAMYAINTNKDIAPSWAYYKDPCVEVFTPLMPVMTISV